MVPTVDTEQWAAALIGNQIWTGPVGPDHVSALTGPVLLLPDNDGLKTSCWWSWPVPPTSRDQQVHGARPHFKRRSGDRGQGNHCRGSELDVVEADDGNIVRDRISDIPLAMVGLLTALPDTQLWRRLEKEGRLLDVSSGNNTDCTLNFVPRMDTRRLVEGYKKVIRNIYSPKEYYRRALDCLSRFHANRIEPRKTTATEDLRAFASLIFTLGVRDTARLDFWSYFYQLLRHHTHDLAHGLTLAAMGYHFRQVTEKYCE